jgi:hypothetical protein
LNVEIADRLHFENSVEPWIHPARPVDRPAIDQRARRRSEVDVGDNREVVAVGVDEADRSGEVAAERLFELHVRLLGARHLEIAMTRPTATGSPACRFPPIRERGAPARGAA